MGAPNAELTVPTKNEMTVETETSSIVSEVEVTVETMVEKVETVVESIIENVENIIEGKESSEG